MNLALQHSASDLKRFQEKVHRKIKKYFKYILFLLRRRSRVTQPVFIMGYGRSGTSMLLNTFERDLRVDVFGENDSRVADNYRLVYDKISPAIEACKTNVLVMKPILNSFDVSSLMNDYRRVKIIWAWRNYQDVVASALKEFGPDVPNYLREIVLEDKGSNWISESLPSDSLEILRELDSTSFTDSDWMALIWWAVNRTVIVHDLYDKERFLLISYEQVVQDVDIYIRNIYDFIGLPYKQPGSYMHTASVKKGAKIKLSTVVDKMCASLCQELESRGQF